MPKLIVMTDMATTRQVALREPETTVGRASTNDIVIDHEQVSRFHAVLITEGTRVTIKDLNSRNGVQVNGVKVASQALSHGDTLSIGSSQMRFLGGDQEITAVEAPRLMTPPGLLVDLDRRAEAPDTVPLAR
ncbi:FHA domain-containing protein [Variovorax sp. PBL-E5]|uniref:FHA domain-containing protein n=1 Tax=Variovorax sp. PBL-E5 TaxID=434014 RepID=UPI001317C44F|nr:FHA domain-containing protein [Variovorax sp. PBL-E5]VTU30585.1 Transcriptional regulatory protein EmbR [Variovorax sp. PBL-E5]